VTYEFDLISELGELGFVDHGFERAAYLLRECQPATRVRLIGSPPSRMGVRAQVEPSEVAPGILAEVEMLAERFQIASERPVGGGRCIRPPRSRWRVQSVPGTRRSRCDAGRRSCGRIVGRASASRSDRNQVIRAMIGRSSR